MQEVVELVIFALIALLVGTGVVWLAGWMLGLVGTALTWLAGLVWSLLRFLVPIAVVAGAVYLLVKLMNRSAERVAGEPQKQPATPPSPWTMSKEPKEASEEASGSAAAAGSAPEADAAPDTSSVPSKADEPKPPATNRWEGEGGSVTNGDEAGDEAGDSRAASDDEARDEGDEKGGDEDDERRHGGEPS